MKEVKPLDLIPGEIYYIENTMPPLFLKKTGLSPKGIGEFVKSETKKHETEERIYGTFKNLKSVNDKPFKKSYSLEAPDIMTIYIGPGKSSYKFYKNYKHSIVRANKKAQQTAIEKILNKQKLPTTKISPSTLFDENPFYKSDNDKTDIGTLMAPYVLSFLNKKSAGKRPCKTCKQPKSSRTKSRRR